MSHPAQRPNMYLVPVCNTGITLGYWYIFETAENLRFVHGILFTVYFRDHVTIYQYFITVKHKVSKFVVVTQSWVSSVQWSWFSMFTYLLVIADAFDLLRQWCLLIDRSADFYSRTLHAFTFHVITKIFSKTQWTWYRLKIFRTTHVEWPSPRLSCGARQRYSICP